MLKQDINGTGLDFSENSSVFVSAEKKRLLRRFFVLIFENLYVIPPYIIQIFVTISAKILFKTFARFQVDGLENLKNIPSGVIFASNHVSELDPIIVASGLPLFSRFLPMFYTSRDKSFYAHMNFIKRQFYGGIFFKILGAYEVYVGKFNYEKSLQNHIPILLNNRSVCIFPEGKRSLDGKIGEAKGGVGYLMQRVDRPVVPVTIIGASNISALKFFLFRNQIRVVYGKPIYPGDLFPDLNNIIISQSYDDCRIVAKKIMDVISNRIS